jgi:hypothetical protein
MRDKDLFGLGAFMPQGLVEYAPLIGAGASGIGSLAARRGLLPAWFGAHPEATGLITAGLASLAMWAFPSTRGGALMTFLGGLAASAPRLIEAAIAGTLGYTTYETANPTLGYPVANQINGLGYAVASNQPHAYGTVPGVAGAGGGAIAGPAMDTGGNTINLLGSGSLSNLARNFGSTIIG